MPHAEYIAALRLGESCRAQLPALFEHVDVLLAPCVNGEAPRGLEDTGDPGFQAIWTILHAPALSMPTHRGPNGLPVGIQLVAQRHNELRLLACARWIWQRLGTPETVGYGG
jgi:Asp-tRNA(Asn)/Glu-tRNA(Gln) amidotransferase A subunit family amidase